MRSFVKVVALSLFAGICIAQQGVDPAYLQQYYQQVASQAGHRAAANVNPEATPIFESNPDLAQQYIAQQQPQQIRIKDIAQDQVRAQQQQTPQHTQAYIAPSVRQYLQHQPQPQVQYVSQPQAVQYKPAPAKQNLHRPRPQPEEYESPAGKLNKEEDYDPNPSYQFGFDVKDDEFTNYQNRKEVRDGDVIKGSYSVVDSDGFIRTVKYTADPKEGFKAEVIREPTDIVVKIPTPPPHTQLLSQQAGAQQYLRQAPPSSRYQEKAPQPQYQYQQ